LSALGIFAALRREAAGLEVHIESAGTSGWHIGEPPDSRSIEAGQARGYSFAGQASRKVTRADFGAFDYVLAMDGANVKALKEICPENYLPRIGLFLDYAPNASTRFSIMRQTPQPVDYAPNASTREVPDPYYGGGAAKCPIRIMAATAALPMSSI